MVFVQSVILEIPQKQTLNPCVCVCVLMLQAAVLLPPGKGQSFAAFSVFSFFSLPAGDE